MKLGQLIELSSETFFSKIMQEIPDLFFFFKNDQYEVRASGLQLSFNIFR